MFALWRLEPDLLSGPHFPGAFTAVPQAITQTLGTVMSALCPPGNDQDSGIAANVLGLQGRGQRWAAKVLEQLRK